jgi:hypothetical protein
VAALLWLLDRAAAERTDRRPQAAKALTATVATAREAAVGDQIRRGVVECPLTSFDQIEPIIGEFVSMSPRI